MNLLDKLTQNIPFLNKTAASGEFYFGLNIAEDSVEGAVWGINGHKLEIVNTAKAKYKGEPQTANSDSATSLIEASNYALDDALADFEPEPEKVLFGVPDNFLQDEDLKPEYLKLLRRMVKELGVAPMAYVSTNQAIAHYLQKQQGVPLTAVLIKISDPLTVSVVKAGKIVGSKTVRRTESLPKDVERALMSFTEVEVLPSKILIYEPNDEKLKDEKATKLRDELQSYSWMSQLPFLHLPKIEDLPSDITLKAVCLAGASEIAPDVSFSFATAAAAAQDLKVHSTKALPEEIGDNFKMDDNLKTTSDEEWLQEEGQREVMLRGNQPMERYPDAEADSEMDDRGYSLENTGLSKYTALILAPFKSLMPKGGGSGNIFLKYKMLMIPLLVLILLMGAYLFLVKAKVTIFIDMRVLEKDAQITADPKVSLADENSKTIPGKILETSVTGQAKGAATGKKKVGDPAKGSVVIYNKTSAPKTFSQGTVLTAPGNLNFVLDTSVNVASQSAVEGGISFGKATGSVTASEIGPEGNLAAGTELAIKDQSSSNFSAKVDSALSGGVSKDVTVVTGDDQKKLLAQVTSDLRQKAQQQLQAKLTGDMKILEEGLAESVTSTNFSKKVGDQASDLTLSLTANYRGTAYSDTDLKNLVSKLVAINVPDGYELDLSKTETQADVSKLEKDGKIIFLAKFRAKLMPKLNLDEIKKKIAFKTPDQAVEEVKKIDNVIGSNIEMSPKLPAKVARLPFLPQNISIEVTAK